MWMTRGFACSLLLPSCAAAQIPAVEGKRVAEVRVVDESGNPVPRIPSSLPLEAGKTFDFADERETLRALYRMGDFSEIRVAAAEQTDGLHVDFIVERNFYNNIIRVEGLKEPPTEPAVLAAMRLNLGEPFRDSSLRDAIARLKDALRADGFYLPKVAWDLEPHQDTRQMDITVHVDPGPRALIGEIQIKNQTPYPDAELLHRTKLTTKNEFTSARISRATQRLKKYLVDQGYLGAGAVVSPGDYDAASNRVPLHLEVAAGPRVQVNINGAHLSKGKMKSLLPIYAEGAVDEDLLQEGRRNIRDQLQKEGYFDANVQVSSQSGPNGERLIVYEVSRGDRFRLAGVAFEGNKYFSTDLLSSRLLLQPASFASNGRFSQQLVRADADSLRALYLSNGYRDVQVSSTVDENYKGKKGSLYVTFHIVEGPQTRVASLQIEGNRAKSKDALLAVIGSTPGQPYSEADVASDRNNILAMYYNEGFPEARFQEAVQPADDPDRVELTYHIREGEKIEVSQVLLTGYQFTRPGIIRRQVQIQPGGPLREGDVVESQRRLYNLGVFSRVTIAPQNPNGTDPEKAMVVNVQEAKRYTIGYGGGFEVQRIAGNSTNPTGTTLAASPRGIFEISRSDMFGRAQTLSLKGRASTLEYRGVLSYTADNFWNIRKLSLQLTGFADKTQDVDTFTSTRYEGAVQLIENLSPGSSILFRYFFRRVLVSNIATTINPAQIPLLSLPTLVSGFGVTYARDRRDNPADPRRGNFNTVDASVALRSMGSSASFSRVFFQNSTYHPFGRAFVFARSARFGYEKTLNPTHEEDIPLPERFFAGGGTSIRGFALNQAGPRDPVTGFPIGGLALLAFNQELRFPMRLPIVENRLGGTIFYDAGNVFQDINHISFAWKPPANNNLAYFSHTVGFGFRYQTPIGPVRVDFGYQLNPAHYEAVVAPATTPASYRLPAFQFFFNIGPIF